MKAHRFADIFPLMSGKEFTDLKKDIKENGLMDEIVTFEGKILDGRNRLNACNEVGVKPRLKEYDGDNALQFVMSTNLKRRSLTDSQLTIVGIRYEKEYAVDAKERKLNGKPLDTSVPRSRELAGNKVGISGSYIQLAKKLIKAKPELEEKIRVGEVKVKTAFRELQIAEQKKEVNKLKGVVGEYNVLVLDPPWPYVENYDSGTRRVSNPYPCMQMPEIRKIKLPTADNCVLWLWTTHKFMKDAIELMEHWGFEYKAILTWDKEKLGMGSWMRMQCEFCLLGIKGKPVWDMKNERDIIREARTTHSTKPEAFYTMVDKLCAGRKLDYFARKERKGWDVYGNDVKNRHNDSNSTQGGSL